MRTNAISKVTLAMKIWSTYATVRIGLRRRPLPALVDHLRTQASPRSPAIPPVHLGTIVFRLLRVGPYRARCLTSSLVLYRLLGEYRDRAEVVIGLPQSPVNHHAHAWVELDGVEIGPPPGRGDHVEMARYPITSTG